MDKYQVLQQSSFGARVAEDEADELAAYFVQTDQWRRIYAGEVDVVYGDKGSGKSAIYANLVANRTQLFDRSVLLVAAENPRGATAFRDLVADPPTGEQEFIGLWKLYSLSLVAGIMKEYGINTNDSRMLISTLEKAGLLPEEGNLRKLIRASLDYVRALLKIESLKGTVEIDPKTGLINGLSGTITLREPSQGESSKLISVETLFGLANRALRETGYQLWVALDRLDVAFAENVDLEQNALRALFKVYIDMLAHDRIQPKIFLRTDIWRRITRDGFREASHVTRHTTISWSPEALMNLLIRRALSNQSLRDHFRVNEEDVLSDQGKQSQLFYRIFPQKVDPGEKKSVAFVWILSRTKDGSGHNAPRELIHLINASRERQLRMLETGGAVPPDEVLISSPALKEGLVEVSKVRYEQTLLAEYPKFRPYLEKLRGEKTQQSVTTLASIWKVDAEVAHQTAGELVEVGFFEPRGTKDAPQFWVPFLYRDALDMVQGAAEPLGEVSADD